MINLFEQILTLRGYPYKQAKAELQKIKAMSADELVAWQIQKAWEIAQYHYEHNEAYKKLVGDTFPDRWEDLPIVTKKNLQQPVEQLISSGVNLKQCHVGSTSGSTGTPFFYAKDKFAHAMTWALIADRYNEYGITLQSKQARFYGIPKEYVAARKERLKDRLMNRVRFSVFDLSDDVLDGCVKRFKNESFDYVYGYTSALVVFARYLIKKQIVLKEITPSLKLCICTSETCTKQDEDILKKGFGVTVVREYGLSETCITAFDDKKGRWKLTEETLFTEDVDGEIISTSLYNKAFPMVRYATGDTGTISVRGESGYRDLEQLTGRTNDIIQLPDNRRSAGLSFYYIARSVLEQTNALVEFIVRQTALDSFEFDVVANRALNDEERQLLIEKTKDYLSANVNVQINEVQKIDRPASGKLKHFYSEISE